LRDRTFSKWDSKYAGAHSTKSPCRGAVSASRFEATSANRCAFRVCFASSILHRVDSSRHFPESRSRYFRTQNADFEVFRKNAMPPNSHKLPHTSTKIVWDKVGFCSLTTPYKIQNSLPLHHEAMLYIVFEALAGGSHTAPTFFWVFADVQQAAFSSGRLS
jgi:hypothetical protein